MPAYLIIANGDSNKSYKCNTTHTSVPYIQVNENNYLDLTSETTTGLQLKYKQKTGSSYSVYNTSSSLEKTTTTTTSNIFYSGQWYSGAANISVSSNVNYPILPPPTIVGVTTSSTSLKSVITESTTSRETTNTITHTMSLTYETEYNITDISSTIVDTTKTYSSSELYTTQSKVTFKNRIYIPVQSQSTTITTTRSSQYTTTTGYSGISTYDTTTTQTTGYSGRSFYNVDNRKTTGYSGITSIRRTTATGYRSTTTSARRTSTTGYTGRSTYRQTTGYSGVVRRTSTTRTYYSGWKKTLNSVTVNMTALQNGYGSSSTSIIKSSSNQTTAAATLSKTLVSTSRKTTYVGVHSYMTYWTTSIVSARYNTKTYTTRITSKAVGAMSSTTALTRTTSSYRSSTAIGALVSATALTKTYITSITSRYATSNYSPYYADFTATASATVQISGIKTATNTNGMYSVTALISGTSYTTSSYRTSSAVGALSSTTALTLSGTRTSSSYKWSSLPGILLSTTELTETSSRTSLTNRTSSTDL